MQYLENIQSIKKLKKQCHAGKNPSLDDRMNCKTLWDRMPNSAVKCMYNQTSFDTIIVKKRMAEYIQDPYYKMQI